MDLTIKADFKAAHEKLAKTKRALRSAVKKAGSTALRDMRSEASKRIRARKRIKVRVIHRAFTLVRPKGGNIEDMAWTLRVSGKPVPLAAYPHRQTKKGVSVTVNQGKRTLVQSAFVATMKSGHKGVFIRRGAKRLPIRELLGSRPVDALLKKGEAKAVLKRGRASFAKRLDALLRMEK